MSIDHINCRYLVLLFIIALICVDWSYSYDASPLTFNPSGRILQVEYAIDAMSKGDPVIALKCLDGIIILTAKKEENFKTSHRRMEKYGPRKIFYVDNHICIAATGLLFDSLVLVEEARKIALKYRKEYGEGIPLENFCDELASGFHQLTISGESRPIGLGLVICGYDPIGQYQIYTVLPDGSCNSWKGIALGKYSKRIQETISTLLLQSRSNITTTNVNSSFKNKTESSSSKQTFSTINETLHQIQSQLIKKYFPYKSNKVNSVSNPSAFKESSLKNSNSNNKTSKENIINDKKDEDEEDDEVDFASQSWICKVSGFFEQFNK